MLNPSMSSSQRRSRLPRDLSRCPSRVHTQMCAPQACLPTNALFFVVDTSQWHWALMACTDCPGRPSTLGVGQCSVESAWGLMHIVWVPGMHLCQVLFVAWRPSLSACINACRGLTRSPTLKQGALHFCGQGLHRDTGGILVNNSLTLSLGGRCRTRVMQSEHAMRLTAGRARTAARP